MAGPRAANTGAYWIEGKKIEGQRLDSRSRSHSHSRSLGPQEGGMEKSRTIESQFLAPEKESLLRSIPCESLASANGATGKCTVVAEQRIQPDARENGGVFIL